MQSKFPLVVFTLAAATMLVACQPAFADGNLLFNRSGMSVSQTAEVIAEILHGVSFGERTERVRWRRIETHAQGESQRVTTSRA